MNDTTQPRRGRPRDASRDELILETTRSLLSREGYGAVSMQAVAREAGVGKDTMYRRWRDRGELVYAALFSEAHEMTAPDTGSLENDLVLVLDRLQREFGTPLTQAALPHLLSDLARSGDTRRQMLDDYLGPSWQLVRRLLDRARERGEIQTAELDDTALDAIFAVVFMRVGVFCDEPDRDRSRRLARLVVGGLGERQR